VIGLFVMLFSFNAHADSGKESDRLERSVCGFKEPFVFWLWSSAAGSPDASRLKGEKGVEAVTLETRDGRLLRGYMLKAASKQPKGYLLVAQGNAMLADQILLSFRAFAEAGYDVYVYDYRGYGGSEGKRRLLAMISDYRQIIGSLDARAYKERRFYGMSFGGIVLLNALEDDCRKKKIVIDSTPSRLSNYGCPERFDPLNNLPQECSEFLMIGGMEDPVVPPSASSELRKSAAQKGAEVLLDPGLSHPFMDPDPAEHRRRMEAVRAFLADDAQP
jgi:alpha-beta hydrolase superfamily lysophospholipase